MPSRLIAALKRHGPAPLNIWAYLYNVHTVSSEEAQFMMHDYPLHLENTDPALANIYKTKVIETLCRRPNLFQKYQKEPHAFCALWLLSSKKFAAIQKFTEWLPHVNVVELNTPQGRLDLESCLNVMFVHGRPDIDYVLDARSKTIPEVQPYLSIVAAMASLLNEDAYTPLESYGLPPSDIYILRMGHDMGYPAYETMQPLFARLRAEQPLNAVELPTLDALSSM